MRFIVLSDAHVVPASAQPLRGIDSARNFRAAVACVTRLEPPPEFVVHLGDLVGDASQDAYREFTCIADSIQCPQFALIGNHDELHLLTRAMPIPDRIAPLDAPHGYYSFDWGPLHLVAVNSRVEGHVAGHVAAKQLAWLEDDLERHRSAMTLVLVHHPPMDIGIEWLDQLKMDNGAHFASVVEGAGNVAAVIAGHVHQRKVLSLGSLVLHTVPSTWATSGCDRGKPIDDGQGFIIVETASDHLRVIDVAL